ncbi:hypothetical protein HAX54_022911, partial [Datura stramonium]|nr:hypothetical protein [Datura stramonium]
GASIGIKFPHKGEIALLWLNKHISNPQLIDGVTDDEELKCQKILINLILRGILGFLLVIEPLEPMLLHGLGSKPPDRGFFIGKQDRINSLPEPFQPLVNGGRNGNGNDHYNGNTDGLMQASPALVDLMPEQVTHTEFRAEFKMLSQAMTAQINEQVVAHVSQNGNIVSARVRDFLKMNT